MVAPIDAAFYGVLSALAIGVLIRRSSRTRALLAENWPVLIYFFYCLISVAWSYHPDVSFKRWIKAIGDLAMVLVITTEPQFRDALCRLFSASAFCCSLLPSYSLSTTESLAEGTHLTGSQ